MVSRQASAIRRSDAALFPRGEQKMNTPEWFKPGAWGFVIGGIAVAIVGFSWGGWMTGGSADLMAKNRAETQVTAALVPVCLEISRADPNRVAKLETIKKASVYNRDSALMDAGWATMPGASKPDRQVASACLDGLKL
jgi:hypothetical protein